MGSLWWDKHMLGDATDGGFNCCVAVSVGWCWASGPSASVLPLLFVHFAFRLGPSHLSGVGQMAQTEILFHPVFFFSLCFSPPRFRLSETVSFFRSSPKTWPLSPTPTPSLSPSVSSDHLFNVGAVHKHCQPFKHLTSS